MNSQHTPSTAPMVSLDDFVAGVTPKGRTSVIDPFAIQVAEAIEVRKLSYEQVAQWLASNGVRVSKQSVGKWWTRRKADADARLAAASPAPAVNYGRRATDVVRRDEGDWIAQSNPPALPAPIRQAPAENVVPPPAPEVGGKLKLTPTPNIGKVSTNTENAADAQARRKKAMEALSSASTEVSKKEGGTTDVDKYFPAS